MNSRLIFAVILSSITFILIIHSGCKSGTTLVVGDIVGLLSIDEYTSTQYSVSVNPPTGVTYAWAVDPSSAGNFTDGTSSSATFHAGLVDSDLSAKIMVTITSGDQAPILKELTITIRNVEGLLIGDIQGQATVDGNTPVEFSVYATGDTGITYQWSTDPVPGSTFTDPTASSTLFVAAAVNEDTPLNIIVTVTSDNYGPVQRNKLVTNEGIDIPVELDIDVPFLQMQMYSIFDIGIEGDGDLVFCTDSGAQLFSPFGDFKRTMSANAYSGIASANNSSFDTGKGIMATSPISGGIPVPLYDDQFLESGVSYEEEHGDGQFGTYDLLWWNGEPDPYYPDTPVITASTSPFSSCDKIPHPFVYQPSKPEYSFQKVTAPLCIADNDVDWPENSYIDLYNDGRGILAYHRDAPEHPDGQEPGIFVGGEDFVVYYDFDVHQQVQDEATDIYLTAE